MGIVITFVLSIAALLLLSVIISAFFFAIDAFLDLPYVATDRWRIETIINLASIKRGETVIDLGSGDGRLLFAAARKGAKAIGYEINPFLIFLTRVKARLLHLRGGRLRGPTSKKNQNSKRPDLHAGSVTVKRQNLWQADLKGADIILVYGRKKTMQKFQDFVYQNAKKGARIIVNTNPFPNKRSIKSQNGISLYLV